MRARMVPLVLLAILVLGFGSLSGALLLRCWAASTSEERPAPLVRGDEFVIDRKTYRVERVVYHLNGKYTFRLKEK